MTQTILTIFATFVLFVGGVVNVTEAVNKLFKVENHRVKFVISWAVSIVLACLGLALQLGMFADLGTVDQWQAWVKTVAVGVGGAFAANKVYDTNEIWDMLNLIFSLFDKKK